MKIESNKNWTTCLRLNTGDGSPRVFLLNSHFLGSVPIDSSIEGAFSKKVVETLNNKIEAYKTGLPTNFKGQDYKYSKRAGK